jgi:acetoin utilization deacetylase AcuC-like enzyme
MLAGWGDDEYQAIFEDILAPMVKRFEPQLILVSAGYDAHWADRLSMMDMSISGFARLVEILKTLASMYCQGRLVFALEGGYHLEALSFSISATLNILLGNGDIADPLGKSVTHRKPASFDNFVSMIKEIHPLWF